MIQFRLDNWGIENPFSEASLLRLHELSGGVPRETLLLCQQAYDRACDDDRAQVLPSDVDTAHAKLQISDPEPAAEAMVV